MSLEIKWSGPALLSLAEVLEYTILEHGERQALKLRKQVMSAVYLTCLYNYVQPLIRYRIGDIVSPRCSDRRYAFSKIGNISGRSEDVMWFNNALGMKEFLHPLSVEGLCIDGLTDYQFILTSETHFELHIQTSGHKDINEQLKTYLGRILDSNGLENVSFDIKQVNTIGADKQTGKKRLIVDKR